MPQAPSIPSINGPAFVIVQNDSATPLASPYIDYRDLPLGTVLCPPPAGAPGVTAPAWVTIVQGSGSATLHVNPPGFSTTYAGFTCWCKLTLNGATQYSRIFLSYGIGPGGILPGQYSQDGHQRAFLIERGDAVFQAIAGKPFSFIITCEINTALTLIDKPAWITMSGPVGAEQSLYTFSGTAPQTLGVVGFNVNANTGGIDPFDATRLFISVAPPPAPVVSASVGRAVKGVTLSFQISASDSPTSYGAVGLPVGLSINAATGVISGTAAAVGTYSVSISATNAGGTGTAIWLLTVSPLPPPTPNNSDASGAVGKTFSYRVTASGSPTSYGATGLPPGLTFNAGSGVVGGVPTHEGSYNVTLTATGQGGTATQAVVFTIAPAAAGAGGDSGSGGGTSTAETSPNALIQIDLVTSKITAQVGALTANHGDAVNFQVQFGPPGFVGTVSNVSFVIKEKGETTQFLKLLSGDGATSTDGTTFFFPATAISGPALDASIELLDEVAPSTVLTYSIQFYYRWNGRSRSSQVVDYVVTRDLTFAAATGAGSEATPVDPPDGGGGTPADASFSLAYDGLIAGESYRLELDFSALGSYPANYYFALLQSTDPAVIISENLNVKTGTICGWTIHVPASDAQNGGGTGYNQSPAQLDFSASLAGRDFSALTNPGEPEWTGPTLIA